MKSALKIITSSKSNPDRAIVALLEVALEVLDADGSALAAVYVDMGLNAFLERKQTLAEHGFDRIGTLQ